MNDILPIKNTLKVISNCWNDAENLLKTEILERHSGAGEVFITELFHGLLKDCLDSASKKKIIENAFIQDLKEIFPYIDYKKNVTQQCANGLIAEVKLHNQTTETKTGGDLGFVIARPHFYLEHAYLPESDLIITKDYRRGVLTQAKLKNDKGKWNGFTPTQDKVLPRHQDYLALLLFSYSDQNRYNLEQFRWQLCKGYPFVDLKNWFKDDYFPNPLNSSKIINDLGNAKIGTGNPQIIRDIICPPENRSLIIDIHWPDGPPISRVRIRTRQLEKQDETRVTLRIK